MQLKVIAPATGRPVPVWLGWSPWMVVLALLGLFALYTYRLPRLKRGRVPDSARV